VNYNGQLLQGQDVILQLTGLSIPVSGTLYSINLDDVLMTILEKYISVNATQEYRSQGNGDVD
jgi:hypothetical protein